MNAQIAALVLAGILAGAIIAVSVYGASLQRRPTMATPARRPKFIPKRRRWLMVIDITPQMVAVSLAVVAAVVIFGAVRREIRDFRTEGIRIRKDR
jgi:hypothetical protein